MPRRIGNLWPTLIAFDNLHSAFLQARRGKRQRPEVRRFEFYMENELSRLREELSKGAYTPGPFRHFEIREPKPRIISAAPFRDRVVHHAFCNVIEPIFERSFIFDSYACRKGKGTHAAVDRYQHFARRFRYVLKCDVQKFFPSIDHAILKAAIQRKIKDVQVLTLAETIMDHGAALAPVSTRYFGGDDLLTPLARRCGLPIGNQTSQFFGNVYLSALDHFIKDTLSITAYLRYCDDFVILGNDKRALAEIRDLVIAFLSAIRLRLHPTKRQISRTCDGVSFLGYRVFATHRLLTREGVVRAARRLESQRRQIARGRLSFKDFRQSLQSWIGHAQHADTWGLRRSLLWDRVFTGPSAENVRPARRVLE